MAYPFTYPVARADPASARAAARDAMRRAAAVLNLVGGLATVASIATPQPHRGPVIVLAALTAVCLVTAAVLLLAPRLPDLALLVAPFLGVVVVTVPMAVEGTPTGTPFFYLWPGLMAAAFLRLREFALTLGWMAACFALALGVWVDSPDGDAILFVNAVLAVCVTCAVVFVLKLHVVNLVVRLHHASRTDPLTGVLNRRAFEDVLDGHAALAARGQPFVLALMDLDHFKQVNDRLGHAAGDRALRRFAEVVLAEKRHDDALGRLGGEEFGLLLAGTDLDGARTFADRLRATIQANTADDEAPLSVSVGLAEYRADEPLDELMRAADTGLYAAKAAGRNRVVAGAAAA